MTDLLITKHHCSFDEALNRRKAYHRLSRPLHNRRQSGEHRVQRAKPPGKGVLSGPQRFAITTGTPSIMAWRCASVANIALKASAPLRLIGHLGGGVAAAVGCSRRSIPDAASDRTCSPR